MFFIAQFYVWYASWESWWHTPAIVFVLSICVLLENRFVHRVIGMASVHMHVWFKCVCARNCVVPMFKYQLIKFWLRTCALRVSPVDTRLTVYRRYHIFMVCLCYFCFCMISWNPCDKSVFNIFMICCLYLFLDLFVGFYIFVRVRRWMWCDGGFNNSRVVF
jgi:hypothetical protein